MSRELLRCETVDRGPVSPDVASEARAAAPTRTTVQLVALVGDPVEASPATRHEARAGDVIGERYELHERLAAGGLGVVFRAIHRETGRVVAVKLLHDRYRDEPSLIERTAREARFACSIHHPSIVEVIDAGRSADGQAYITMEFLDGRTLRAVLKASGCVDAVEAAQIMLPIVEAVAAAHAVGVVHRDLKPENVILVEVAGVRSIKVLDFGIAGAVSEPGVDERLTTVGTVLGTHAYMSPEQATGGDPDPSFDVFSLGVMMYELLTGVLPFGSNPARSLTAKIRGVVDAAPYDCAEVPAPWRVLVARCIAGDSARRPTAAELRAEIVALAGPQRRSVARSLGAMLRRARLGLGVVAVIAVMGAGTWFALSSTSTPAVIATDPIQVATATPAEPPPPPLPTVVEPSAAPTLEPRDAIAEVPVETVVAARSSSRSRNPKRSATVRPPTPTVATEADEVACDDVRAAMRSAREGHRWSDMLASAAVRQCWTNEARKQWRTKALMELGRFEACAAEGKDASAEQVRDWASLCERRLAARPQ